jgi:hypothetical protein
VAALKRRLRRRGQGGPASGRCKPGVDLSHQTLASARNPKGFGGARRVRQQPTWRSGARRPDRHAGREPKGPSPCPFLGYGHGAAAEKVNRQDAGYDARDEEHRENQAEVRYRQVTHGALTSAKSGRKGRNVDKAEGAEGQRRRRVPFPVPRRGTDLPGCSCMRLHPSGWKKGLPANRHPFIKALQACQHSLSP